ncbi:putative transmembrane protein [Crotalus adamanteus]|uniref:Transmembrane protein n=1 Tax=Crotalus adamanteus TaxID=8729 RepID=A0AAW1BKP2_CROAD
MLAHPRRLSSICEETTVVPPPPPASPPRKLPPRPPPSPSAPTSPHLSAADSGPADYAPQNRRTRGGAGRGGGAGARAGQSAAPARGPFRPAAQSEPGLVTSQDGGPGGRRVTQPSRDLGSWRAPSGGGSAEASEREVPIKQIKMTGKEFLDHPMEKMINNSRRISEATWEKMFEKLPAQDQSFFQNGGLILAFNSSLLALISNNSFRKILHVTQARYSTVAAMSLMPFTITTVGYEAIVKHSLMTGNLNCEICAMVRGSLVGAVIGYFYPIIIALPLNALLATSKRVLYCSLAKQRECRNRRIKLKREKTQMGEKMSSP